MSRIFGGPHNVTLTSGGAPDDAGVVGFGGILADSTQPGIGVVALGESPVDSSGNGYPAFESQNVYPGGNNMIAYSSGNAPIMSLADNGTMILSGPLYANGIIDCSGGDPSCPPSPANQLKMGRPHSYAPRQDVPTMETVGEGQLTNGMARVALGQYASKIDTSKSYLVFITPQGQTQGNLYVAGKSPEGFAVRENQGGHSTVAFDYKVIGVPAHLAASRAMPRANSSKGSMLLRATAVHAPLRNRVHLYRKH